jgi:hypothetical protein
MCIRRITLVLMIVGLMLQFGCGKKPSTRSSSNSSSDKKHYKVVIEPTPDGGMVEHVVLDDDNK